jgi:hypothetical protein
MSPAPRQITMSPRPQCREAARKLVRPVHLAHRAVAALLEALDQRLGIRTLDRLLAGGVDRRDQTMSASLKAPWKSSIRSRSRV